MRGSLPSDGGLIARLSGRKTGGGKSFTVKIDRLLDFRKRFI